MRVIIVVEVDPGTLRSASLNPIGPLRQLILRIVMPIPALGTVQANINLLGRSDELIRQPRSAAGAEDYPSLAKGAVDLFVPPAGMPEFDDVAARGIKLADNVIEPGLGSDSSAATETESIPCGRQGRRRSSQNPE